MTKLEQLVRPSILQLSPYSSARDEFTGNGKLFLDANENPFGELNRYPDPYQCELKSLMSETFEVPVNQLFVGNGSDEVIDLLFRIFCTPGKDKALTFSPTYGMYDVSATINDVSLTKIPLTENFEIDPTSVEPFLSNTCYKLMFICSPNNPTGNVPDLEIVQSLIESFSGIVVIDEAYIDFSETASLSRLVDTYENLVICRTLSKAFGLAGARVGIAITNEAIIQLLNKVKPPYNVSQPNQEAAIEVLKNRKKISEQIKLIRNARILLEKQLAGLCGIIKIYPSEANFLLTEVEDANALYSYLISKGIVVRNRHHVVGNCLRITVGMTEENQQLINALNEFSYEKGIVY